MNYLSGKLLRSIKFITFLTAVLIILSSYAGEMVCVANS